MALFVKQKWNYRFNCAIVYWCVLLDNSVQKKISSKECPLWFCSVNNPKSLSIKSLIAAILCKEWEFFPCCSHLNWTTNNEPWNSTGKMSYIFNFLLPCKIQNNAWIKFNLFNLNQITNFEMFWILFSTLPLTIVTFIIPWAWKGVLSHLLCLFFPRIQLFAKWFLLLANTGLYVEVNTLKIFNKGTRLQPQLIYWVS